jgi:hypothetical protein
MKLANICDQDPSALRPENEHRSIYGNICFKYAPESGEYESYYLSNE